MRTVVKIVGMIAGGRQHIVYHVAERDPALLLPEPSNPYDPNAIAVYTIPIPLLTDSEWTEQGWTLGPDDRTALMDRQAGYVPRELAARLNLPAEGLVGEVVTVRHHPDTNAPVGLDVAADLDLT